MGLILPSYMMRQRRYQCQCGFRFVKISPSAVEKCPMCNFAAYDVNVKKEDLDPYSKTKERWYSRPDGQSHIDDIRNRKIIHKDGKDHAAILDSKGQIKDWFPEIPLTPPDHENPTLNKPKKKTKFKKTKIRL